MNLTTTLTRVASIAGATLLGSAAGAGALTIDQIGRYGTTDPDAFDEAAAEIASFDPGSAQLFVTNTYLSGIDVLDLSDPTNPAKTALIDTSSEGEEPTSCVVLPSGYLAVAIKADPAQAPGKIAFYRISDLALVASVTAGALPDNVVVTPDGTKVISANEGEPDGGYLVDPEGSVTIIDISGGIESVSDADATHIGFTSFNGTEKQLAGSGIRIYGPGASVAQDLEPEYVAVSADSETAYVSLQENNAIAVIDLNKNKVEAIWPLGYVDHSKKGSGFDASNRDGAINIQPHPTLGMRQPDTIATYTYKNNTYLLTANEGDSRDYDGFGEEARAGDLAPGEEEGLALGKKLSKKYPDLLDDADLGRLKITLAPPDGVKVDKKTGDLVFDKLYSYGSRSFSVFEADKGHLVYDSGDDFEQLTAALVPDIFNASNDETEADDRSDDKGPEPEALTIGEIGGTTYAFIGFERVGGVAAYDISDPKKPAFVGYANTRLAAGDPGVESVADDLGPECVVFIPASDSPDGTPLLAVPHEVSGSTVIFRLTP